MRRWIIGLLAVAVTCAVLAIALVVACNAGLGTWLILRTLHSPRWTNLPTRTCTVGRTVLQWNGLLRSDAWRCDAGEYVVTCASVVVDVPALLRRQPASVQALNASVRSRDLSAAGITVVYHPVLSADAHMLAPLASVDIARVQSGVLMARNVHGDVRATATGYLVEPFTLHLFSGDARGALTIEPQAAGGLRLHLDVAQLPLRDLTPFQAEIFGPATGTLHGTLRITRQHADALTIDSAWQAEAPGGRVGSGLLGYIAPYLPPKTPERQRLERAMAARAPVQFDQGAITFTSTGPKDTKIVLNMHLPEYNLLLRDITLDIRLDSTATLWNTLRKLTTP